MSATTVATKRETCFMCEKTIQIGAAMVTVNGSMKLHKSCDDAYQRRQAKRASDRKNARTLGLRAR